MDDRGIVVRFSAVYSLFQRAQSAFGAHLWGKAGRSLKITPYQHQVLSFGMNGAIVLLPYTCHFVDRDKFMSTDK